MAETERRAWEELSRSINQLVLKEPFFGHLLSSVIRDVNPATPTMAVGARGARIVLQVNPDFLLHLKFDRDNLAKCERTAVVKHEVLHLVFRHIFRAENREPRVYNLAADIVVNQFVKPWGLPEGGITLQTFPDLDLKPDQSLDWYYNKLMEVRRNPKQAPKSAETLDKLLGEEDCAACGGNGNGSGLRRGDHRLWGKSQDIDQQVADSVLDRLIVQARERTSAKDWGLLPGQIRELVEAAIDRQRPKLDWRRVIRLFAASSRKTRVDNTLRRRSKRYGTFPGIRIERFQRLAVAVDTSGSISDRDLSEFFSEIHGIWRQGAEIMVIECDAQVQRTYPYAGVVPKAVGGRGGTAFDPVFRWLNENRMVRYDGCIYLTDGYAETPATKPTCKLLWVVTANGRVGEHLRWGRAIQLPPG